MSLMEPLAIRLGSQTAPAKSLVMPRYPEYKASGVEWLGEVPGHWDVLPTKRLFRRCKDLNTGMICDNRLALTMSGVIPRDLDDLDGLQASEFETYQIFQKDDLAFKLIDLQNIKTSRVGIVPTTGIMSPAYIRLAASSNYSLPRYFYWYFTDLYNQQVFNQLGGGVRQTMGPEELLFLPISVPTLEEQGCVADFLDRETGKIDALIAEQRRLVELLAEKRQAVISHAVTKGLNPNAKMKDSGIEWLGEVPEHWEVNRLKFVATVQTGIAKGKDNAGKDTISVPYLRVANVQDGYLDLEDVATIDIPLESLDRYRLQSGDVLMNEGGDFDKLGRGHVWRCEVDPCIHQNHVFAVRPHSISSEWLNLVTGTNYAQFYFMTRSKQSTNLASISSTNIMELPVVCPPDEEQATIATFLNKESTKFDTLTAEANRAIELLQERRSALISAAVTGKIDVRTLSPSPLPQAGEGQSLEVA